MLRGNALFLALVCFASIPLHALAQTAAAVAYTPSKTTCPKAPLVRSAGSKQTLNVQEANYIKTRKETEIPHAWRSYLANVQAQASLHNIRLPTYVSALLANPLIVNELTLGIATSGGGYRAAIFGSGILNALDGRNKTSVHAGTGCLLQSASYLTGLSGGSWLVSSLTQANFPLLADLILGGDSDGSAGATTKFGGWVTEVDLLQVSSDPTTEEQFLGLLLEEIAGKFAAGFPVTITDVWSRSLARHFANGTTLANFFNPNITHGAGELWSAVVNVPSLSHHTQPFPIILADTVSKFQNNATVISTGEGIPLSNPLYEISPYEFGSYDPMLSSFVPTQFIGSSNGTCVTGYDQLSYLAGVSSNLFNSPGEASSIAPILEPFTTFFPESGIDLTTAAVPNPFFGVAPHTFLDSNQTIIQLVDGGEDGEVVPIQPLLVKSRGVNVIIAIDSTADTSENFADGSSLIAAKDRAALFPQTYSFPDIPSTPAEFAAHNLTTRPAFFGCDTEGKTPLIIYIANGGAPLGEAPLTNTSTAQSVYSPSNITAMLDQTFDVATQGIPVKGPAKDPEWPSCLACAIVDPVRAKSKIPRTGVCASCLKRYCWSPS